MRNFSVFFIVHIVLEEFDYTARVLRVLNTAGSSIGRYLTMYNIIFVYGERSRRRGL